MRVLMAVDAQPVRSLLADEARQIGMEVEECGCAAEAFDAVVGDRPDMIVLALSRASGDSIAAARGLQERAPDVPVLLLSAGARLPGIDRVVGAEQLALLSARRGGAMLRYGELELQPGRCRALWNGIDLGCTLCEYRILELLATRRGDAVPVEELNRAASSAGGPAGSNVVAQWISRLRTKLRLHGAADAIETRRGLGYAFVGD